MDTTLHVMVGGMVMGIISMNWKIILDRSPKTLEVVY